MRMTESVVIREPGSSPTAASGLRIFPRLFAVPIPVAGVSVRMGRLSMASVGTLWLISPPSVLSRGVDSVTVDLSGVALQAAIGADSFALKQVFPGYPDSAHSNFSVQLSPADLARAGSAGPPTLRVLVKSRTGAVTEVDRRRLEPAP